MRFIFDKHQATALSQLTLDLNAVSEGETLRRSVNLLDALLAAEASGWTISISKEGEPTKTLSIKELDK